MLYAPPDALLQLVAAAANEPDGSGNTYQLSVTGPFELDEPHAARRTVVSAAAAVVTQRLRPLDPPGPCLVPDPPPGDRLAVRTENLSPHRISLRLRSGDVYDARLVPV